MVNKTDPFFRKNSCILHFWHTADACTTCLSCTDSVMGTVTNDIVIYSRRLVVQFGNLCMLPFVVQMSRNVLSTNTIKCSYPFRVLLNILNDN